MTVLPPKPEHKVAYADLCALISKHASTLTALELLAVGANMLGKLVALQDQRIVTKEGALEVLARNLEQGNAEAIAELRNNTKGTA